MLKFAFLAAIAAITSAQTCFPDNSGSDRVTNCHQFIDTFCGNTANIQHPEESFGAACYPSQDADGRNEACTFYAVNTRQDTNEPVVNTCESLFNEIFNQCNSTGGYGKAGPNAYTFSISPTLGTCEDVALHTAPSGTASF